MKHPNESDESTTDERLAPLGCSDVLEALPLYVGDDLESDRGPAIEAHLAGCPACGDEARRAREARELFRQTLDESLRFPAATGSLWSGIRRELVADGAFQDRAAPRTRREAPIAQLDAAPTKRDASASAPLRKPTLMPALAGLAAAVTLLLLWRPWAQTGPGAAPGAPFGQGAAELAVPGTTGDVLPVAARADDQGSLGGGLRRVGAQDSTLFQEAQPLLSEQELSGRERSSTTLVNFR